jgi:hypothetical protein
MIYSNLFRRLFNLQDCTVYKILYDKRFFENHIMEFKKNIFDLLLKLAQFLQQKKSLKSDV